ncbi:ParB/Srx family N-terminal domain-containing protein [Bartonella sp. AU55XJBT]|uniref:ParB/Srx family N-terminal domain-containing protein n=1 Tax=Bartonella sp. AU55XJBT TaxID=3019091 RepID=UPI002360225F|nr:ParB/Srx family N-terminal domain-containing protein [Bartonella sp. AU55XJBT]
MAKTKTISLKKLKLDLENPRISRSLTEKEAINFLCDTEKILELAEDIAENGLSPCEKLMVLQDGEKYIVKEGNRRLVALKILDNPSLAPRHLSKKISEYSENRKIQINFVECAIASDIGESNHWMVIKHLGQNNGKGVKPWNAIQKTRYFPSNKNRFAYLLFYHLLENPLLQYDITTVTRLISGSTFFEYTGIYYNQEEDKLIFSHPYEENSALDNFLKQFVKDILEKKVHSRSCNNAKAIAKYFETLSRQFDLHKTFVYSKNVPRKGKNKKETEDSKEQYSLFPNDTNKDKNYQKSKVYFGVYDEEIAIQLNNLDAIAIKYVCIYSSVKKLSTDLDTPLLYIAFSCLFEGLANRLGRKSNESFDEFLKKMLPEKVFNTIPNVTEDRTNTVRTLKKIRENANMAKHGTIAAPLNYREISHQMKVLKPLLVYLIKKVNQECIKN